MAVLIEKIPGGFMVDGLELKGGKCGCTSIAQCCYTWSKVKKRGDNLVEVHVKATTPDTKENHTWSYTVTKDGITVKVDVEDAADKEIFSGYIPPAVTEWEAKGWDVTESTGQRRDGRIWRCSMCKWIYKEDKEGTRFEDLPDDWRCPRCKAGKNVFEIAG